MHPDKRFVWTDSDAMRAFVRDRSFGTLFLAMPDGPGVAHVPVLFTGDEQIAFHLARANPMTPHLDGARALFVAQGADAYVSPDWYGLPDQVPTWNYVAVELTGTARRLNDDALLPLIDALSTEHEARLSPKPVWTSAKMTPGLAQRMTGAIAGFTLDITGWRGTRKLNQNKNDVARQGVVDALTALGNTAMAGEVAAQ